MLNPATIPYSQIITPLQLTETTNITSLTWGTTIKKFIGNNKWNVIYGAIASALIAKTWLVTGSIFAAYATCKLTSSTLTLQTWLPRSVRLFLIDKTWIVVGVVSSVALIATKGNALAIALLIYSSYKLIDKTGLIPRKVSLNVERYFPWRALLGFTPPAVSWHFASYLSSMVSYIPRVEQFCYEKFNLIVHRVLRQKNPTLQSISAPLNPKPKLSFEHFYQILDGKDSGYGLDIAHCARSATEIMPLSKEDRHFEKLTTLTKNVSWSEHNQQIISHPAFLRFLGEEFPSIDKKVIEKNPLPFVQKLAEAKKLTARAYANQWLHDRFNSVTKLLNGEWTWRVLGTQTKLDDAIANWAKILPYLAKEATEISYQDKKALLFKLALNSSSQQASDIDAIGKKVLHKITKKALNNSSDTPANLVKRFEFKVLDALQVGRERIIQQIAKTTTKQLQQIVDFLLPPTDRSPPIFRPKHQKNSLLEVIHRDYLSFGFLPVSQHERAHSHLAIKYLARLGNCLFEATIDNQTPDVFGLYTKKINSIVPINNVKELSAYVKQLTEDNHFSSEQSLQIHEKLKQAMESSSEELKNRIRHVILVSMGILRKQL